MDRPARLHHGESAWVNDLDLEVAVGGQSFKGNVFASGLSRTGGSADQHNNVESVYLPAGTTGRLSVTVRGTTLAGDGAPGIGDGTDQDFALVVSNAAAQPAPVLAHGATTVDDSGPGGDSDGRLESDEQVQLTEQVRNTAPIRPRRCRARSGRAAAWRSAKGPPAMRT